MNLIDSRGSTLLETMAMAGLLLLFAIGSARILKSTVTEIWLENELYQILICVNEGRPEAECQHRKMAGTTRLPWDPPKFQIHLQKIGQMTEGVLKWENGKKTLRLDLQGKIQKDLHL